METCRRLVDHLRLSFTQDTQMGYVETDRGRIDLNPPLDLKAGEMYLLELFDNSTISLWQLVADGEVGHVQ